MQGNEKRKNNQEDAGEKEIFAIVFNHKLYDALPHGKKLKVLTELMNEKMTLSLSQPTYAKWFSDPEKHLPSQNKGNRKKILVLMADALRDAAEQLKEELAADGVKLYAEYLEKKNLLEIISAELESDNLLRKEVSHA